MLPEDIRLAKLWDFRKWQNWGAFMKYKMWRNFPNNKYLIILLAPIDI